MNGSKNKGMMSQHLKFKFNKSQVYFKIPSDSVAVMLMRRRGIAQWMSWLYFVSIIRSFSSFLTLHSSNRTLSSLSTEHYGWECVIDNFSYVQQLAQGSSRSSSSDSIRLAWHSSFFRLCSARKRFQVHLNCCSDALAWHSLVWTVVAEMNWWIALQCWASLDRAIGRCRPLAVEGNSRQDWPILYHCLKAARARSLRSSTRHLSRSHFL